MLTIYTYMTYILVDTEQFHAGVYLRLRLHIGIPILFIALKRVIFKIPHPFENTIWNVRKHTVLVTLLGYTIRDKITRIVSNSCRVTMAPLGFRYEAT